MSTALLVIDAQASFPQRPYWAATRAADYFTAQNALIAAFGAQKQPIVRIFHVEAEGVFSLASGYVRSIDGLLPFAESLLIHKNRHSAFAGTPLAHELLLRGIRRVVVSGIRTEQCCETTTRDASDRGFEVDFVTAATLTFDMTHPNGKAFSANEIIERTELVLSGRFARICSVEEAISSL
jgi:nicotinamidase-related amidase